MEGGIQRRKYAEYAPFHTISADKKTVLIRCVHVPYGSPSGYGLPDSERELWEDAFGNLLTKVQGVALLQSDKYKSVDL